jgi:3-phenylpropionate/trans-cinnamate dioxygenase ferredoxin reductase subunit
MRTIAVVGTSLGGFSAAQQLRAQGFDGRLVLVGDEVHLPYDRPPLSKEFLLGKLDRADLALGEQADYDELEADWLPGDPAVRLHATDSALELRSGARVDVDGVVIATGAAARTLPDSGDIAGVHTVRTLDDASALRDELTGGDPRVVVVGAGFIGAEVASTCASLGLHVTIVESAPVPLARALGSGMAQVCTGLHEDHGVAVRSGVGVEELQTAGGRVVGVRLSSGEVLPAEVVVVGIGVHPNTGWLAGSGITLGDGVVCDAGGVTDLPHVVAVGDVARVERPDLGRSLRMEHWTATSTQPRVAVRNLLAGTTVEHHTDLPYFWSDQYGVRIQFAGSTRADDTVRVVDGDVDSRCFLAQYERDGQPVAVLALNQPRAFGRARRQLAKPNGTAAAS